MAWPQSFPDSKSRWAMHYVFYGKPKAFELVVSNPAPSISMTRSQCAQSHTQLQTSMQAVDKLLQWFVAVLHGLFCWMELDMNLDHVKIQLRWTTYHINHIAIDRRSYQICPNISIFSPMALKPSSGKNSASCCWSPHDTWPVVIIFTQDLHSILMETRWDNLNKYLTSKS